MINVIADSYIPFLAGRLEPYCNIKYLHPDSITAEAVKDADALLIRTRTRCNASLLEGSKVRFIASGTIGMDQFDLPYCASRGIATFNSPGCNAPGVAQWVWSCLMHLRINPAEITIGIVGHGHVGSIVAEWGRHLGAKVLLCDPPRSEAGEKGYISLEELLSRSDVVSLHTPLTREGKHATYHMIGEREVSLMRKGAILANAARGPVIDTIPVVKAAQNGSIRLLTDTWEGEPNNINMQQLRLSLIATPHIAGYSLQGKQRATRMILENLARHFKLPLADKPGMKGVEVWDLPEPYRPLPSISRYQIMRSYDPFSDDALLRRSPADFEWERDNYDYRSEPTFFTSRTQKGVPALKLISYLEKGDPYSFIATLKQIFLQYPYDLRIQDEHDFQRIIYAMLLMSGVKAEAEVHSHLGRIDICITMAKYIYILELKSDRTAMEAIEQIEERAYEKGLRTEGREVIKIGLNFSRTRREIDAWAFKTSRD